MKLYNSTQNCLIADDVKIADNFISRTIGLISKKEISHAEGLLIKPCCSIHTFFMRFEIDVLFINRKNEVVALYENVKPWKVLPIHPSSHYVVELCSGLIEKNNISKGDTVEITN